YPKVDNPPNKVAMKRPVLNEIRWYSHPTIGAAGRRTKRLIESSTPTCHKPSKTACYQYNGRTIYSIESSSRLNAVIKAIVLIIFMLCFSFIKNFCSSFIRVKSYRTINYYYIPRSPDSFLNKLLQSLNEFR